MISCFSWPPKQDSTDFIRKKLQMVMCKMDQTKKYDVRNTKGATNKRTKGPENLVFIQ